jgi:hypothetical protein
MQSTPNALTNPPRLDDTFSIPPRT